VQESEVEVGEGEAGDAGLEAMGDKEDCVNVGKVRKKGCERDMLRGGKTAHLDGFEAFVVTEFIRRHLAGNEDAAGADAFRAVLRYCCSNVVLILLQNRVTPLFFEGWNVAWTL
jgi:hypothetical protein